MLELENVLADYRNTKAQNKLVPGQNVSVALQALRASLPALLRGMIEAAGYDANDFHIKASAGEPNRSFAKVPWVAVFKKTISKSATQGYYIVFLFAEDMSSVTVSLNQGYTAFEQRYVHPKLAYPKLKDCARAALAVLAPLPPGFDTGPIDLRADGTLGKGYEAGSILSKTYTAGSTPSTAEVQADFTELLGRYMALAVRFPTSLIDLDIAVSDQDVLEAATNIDLENPGVPKTAGPQPPPPMGLIGSKAKHVRSAEIVARALAISGAACALEKPNEPHASFTSARTKKNYVEAHHLVPFSQQPYFSVSLDVEENIAVLCPTCHRRFHHGTQAVKSEHLKLLFRQREAALQARGIDISLDQLLKMYKALDPDD
jgi:5-methylcytosine-specific restriction protein A